MLTLAISGYRSIRDLVLPLDQLTVITGANGSGKSSLYRAIRLLADVAQGRAISGLAHEGGLQSTLWAGPEKVSRAMRAGDVPVQGSVRRDTIALKLGFASEDYGYAIDLGLPVSSGASLFNLDPEIKTEVLWVGEYLKRSNELARRSGGGVQLLDESGRRRMVMHDIASYDSMMTHVAEPGDAAELLALRERMRGWRFYDQFRTDKDAPARQPQIGTRTPVLDANGANFAAAVQTIREIGDISGLHTAIDEAFTKSQIEVVARDGLFEVVMRQHGLLRPLRTAELSDGTLRYLLLVTALLSPRPPSLLVLNEPENSLHPNLLAPLARLIAKAAQTSQILVVSHAASLVEALEESTQCLRYDLVKELGETRVDGAEQVPWKWPKR
ncbi:MAG: ATP-binding protein [Hyphomicrobiales bacterium]|nr:MAG: ATP-binding protein [Hyphomicrobiales bacterium]